MLLNNLIQLFYGSDEGSDCSNKPFSVEVRKKNYPHAIKRQRSIFPGMSYGA